MTEQGNDDLTSSPKVYLGETFNPLEQGFIDESDNEELETRPVFLTSESGQVIGETTLNFVLHLPEVIRQPSDAQDVQVKFSEKGELQLSSQDITNYDLYELQANIFYDQIEEVLPTKGHSKAILTLGDTEFTSTIVTWHRSSRELDNHREWIASDGKKFKFNFERDDLSSGKIRLKIDSI